MIFRYRAETEYRPLSYLHSRCHDTFCRYPGFVPKLNFFRNEVKALSFPMVISRAEVGTLRKTTIAPNSHFSEIVDPDILTNPTIAAYFQAPGKLHPHTWFNSYPLSYLCRKKPKKKNLERRERNDSTAQQTASRTKPEDLLHNPCSRCVVPFLVFSQIHLALALALALAFKRTVYEQQGFRARY